MSGSNCLYHHIEFLVDRTLEYNRFRTDYSGLKPDLTFYDRWEKREFYLEVKFRPGQIRVEGEAGSARVH